MLMKRHSVLTAVLIVLLIFLQYRLWFQSGGILDLVKLKKHTTLMSFENDILKSHNDLLQKQILQLKQDPQTLESRARHELGMVKKDETFYRVIEE